MTVCRECKFCIGMIEDYYVCNAADELNLIEFVIAEDEKMDCDLYVGNDDDDFTA